MAIVPGRTLSAAGPANRTASATIATVATLIASTVGIVTGLLAGFLGGTVDIDAPERGGTVVTVRLPATQPQEAKR